MLACEGEIRLREIACLPPDVATLRVGLVAVSLENRMSWTYCARLRATLPVCVYRKQQPSIALETPLRLTKQSHRGQLFFFTQRTTYPLFLEVHFRVCRLESAILCLLLWDHSANYAFNEVLGLYPVSAKCISGINPFKKIVTISSKVSCKCISKCDEFQLQVTFASIY